MTTTIGSQRKGWWDYVPSKMLAINYTVSFWAKAREPLNSMMVTGRAVSVYRGIVFYSVGWTNGFVGRGFALGTDGFDLYEHRLGSGGIVVGTQRESLDGWHYYTIVQIGGSSNVYIDGNPMQSLRDNSITNNTVAFDVCFGNPRVSFALGLSANGNALLDSVHHRNKVDNVVVQRNCSECNNTYRSCSRNFSLNGSTKTTSLLSSSTTTTSTMTMITATENSLSPSSSSSTSPTTTTNSTSVVIDVAANSQVLPTIGWIGVVIGTLLWFTCWCCGCFFCLSTKTINIVTITNKSW
jgi:hypothetical protein